MSYRQIPIRAVTALAATAGALAPAIEGLARRRRARRHEDEDDDDNDLTLAMLRRRRRRRQEEDEDDDDMAGVALRARRRQAAQEKADDNDSADDAAEASTAQSIVADLGIRELVAERIDRALAAGGGGGGGGDEPNIEVSQDGDLLLVVTKDVEFAGDAEGFDVETGGISYSSGAGGGLTDDFTS